MKKIILPLVAIWLFTACDDEVKKDSGVPVITIEVERNAFPRNQQKWIYISDASGNILDSEMIHAGTFSLNAETLPDLVNVTIYTITDFDPGRQHELITFIRVPSGKTYKIKKALPQVTFIPPVGSIKFEIANYPQEISFSNFNISNGTPMNIFPSAVTLVDNKVSGFYGMTSSKADLLFTTVRDGMRSYRWVKDVNVSDVINLDYQDFAPCEYNLELPYYAYGSSTGMIGDNPYYFGGTFNVDFQNKAALGYIDGFDYYSTQLHTYGTPRTVHLIKVGDRVQSAEFPTYQGFVTRHSISNFNYAESEEYTYRTVRWQLQSNSLSWQVVGDAGSVNINFLPKELKESFPDASLERFIYAGQTLYKRMDGYTYANYLDERLGVTEPPKFYEYFYVDIFQ